MIKQLSLNRRSSPKDTFRLQEMKNLYSSRAEKLKYVQKLAAKKLKPRQKSAERKRLKLLIQLPKYDTEYSKDDLHSQTPNHLIKINSNKAHKRKRIIFKSSIEKIYSHCVRLVSPKRKLFDSNF